MVAQFSTGILAHFSISIYTHAVLEGKIVSAPKGYDAFTGIEAAREKLACGNIRQQMEEFGIELEIVPVNTDFLLR